MSNVFIGFLVALSASVWIYNKLMHSTGGNAKNAATAAGLSALLIFVAVVIILGVLF